MFNTKKIFGLALSVSMLLGITACGSNNTETSTTNQTAQTETTKDSQTAEAPADKADDTKTEANTDDGKIHLTYWYAWKDKIGESKEELVKQFNESQDKIVVDAEYQGSYDELASKTQAAKAANNAPEIFEVEIANMYTMAKGGMIENLSPFVDDQVDIDDFNEGLMHEAYIDDNLYGLPFYRSTPIMYKNISMLKEAGLDPEGPRDWKEFKEYAEKLRDKDKSKYALTYQLDPWFLEAWVYSSDGFYAKDGKIGFDQEGTKAPARFLQELADEDLIKIALGEQAGETCRQDFVNQNSAFYFTSTANLTELMPLAKENGFDLDVSFVPGNKHYAVPTGGCNIVMISGLDKEKQDATWEFLKFMTATEQNVFASEYTGYLPTRYSSIESDKIKKLHEEIPQYKVAFDQLEYAEARPIAKGWPEMEKMLYEGVTNTTTQGADVDQIYDNLQKQAQSILSF
ncbi:ABC transporter substrate-binding protein [Anaerococcus sp. Marseille-Q7828]|uniref:ABC transporter substrate-binding protein n=1 Tax=Anaerococcus sp. Marseille-Q7828 TaxID=3036300 RepID=UPI0024AE5200|nr:ABC transporter substrate-binding protein [Anaerococcus sp. Marseille-Q7828]